MRPTRFQRLFTDDRPLVLLMAVGSVAALVWVGSVLLPTFSLSVWHVARSVGLLVVAALLGAVLGAFPGGIVVGTLVLPWVEKRNGAPFEVGDEVVILSRRYPGRSAQIYEVWASRHQVRVNLGPAERQAVTDVFNYTDVCLETARQRTDS